MDFQELQRRRKEFLATPLGAAFNRFESAMERYWVNDSNERLSDNRLSKLDEAMRSAREELMPLLREAAGLEE